MIDYQERDDFMSTNLAFQEEWQEELINGKFVAMSPAATNHTFIAGNIYAIFHFYLKGKKCKPFPDGAIVYLNQKDHFVPDFMIVCDRDKIKPDGIHGAPDLAVEILSRSTAKNDKGYKKTAYAKAGVKEYWIVNPVDKSIEQYFLEGEQFILQEIYSLYEDYELKMMKEEERAAVAISFKCSLYDDLLISLEDIFYDMI